MPYSDKGQQILEYLKQNQRATVSELASMLFVSEATVRRELIKLQSDGHIERSHGGAVLLEGAEEHPIYFRREKNAKEKLQAVAVALRHLPDFSTVFVDDSSTCLALIERMNFSHKTVVTNGLQIALRVARCEDVNLVMPGGEIKWGTTAVTGSATQSILQDMHFDLALLSCYSVDEEGSYELSLDCMRLKRTAIENSARRILLFDRTKIGERGPFRTAPLDVYNTLLTACSEVDAAPLSAAHPQVFYK